MYYVNASISLVATNAISVIPWQPGGEAATNPSAALYHARELPAHLSYIYISQ